MPAHGRTVAKQKPTKCSTRNVLQFLLALTLGVFATSIVVTFNLTTSSKSAHAPVSPKLIEEPREFRNGQKKSTSTVRGIVSKSDDDATSSPADEIILQWVRERKDDTSSSLSDLLTTPLLYTPGALPLSQLSTFQHCYSDPSIYSNHLNNGGSKRRAPYSEKYKLALVLVPKSGSSTGRFMMKHEFEAEERFVALEPPLNVIAFVREPLSRFGSQYEEAYVRTAPWQKSDNRFYLDPNTKTQNNQHPFPYLFENIHSYHDYEDVFCPPSTRTNPNSRKECIDKKSAENGTLARRLERFVSEYDGRNPFDVHLKFQVPLLSRDDGYPMYLTELHNTTNSEGDWTAIAKRYMGNDHVFKNKDGVIEGRSYPRRLNSELVSTHAQQRICELALIDYCCLNFPLPGVCVDGEKPLMCKLDYDETKKRARVQPGLFPQKEK